MSIREGAAIAGGKMEVFYYGSFRGRAEHPAQGPCGTYGAGGHPALPGFHILVYHRIAHWLFEHKHFFLARWVSQRGR